MKTKSRLFLIVFLMALVMLVGAFAVAPFTASAVGSVRVDFCLTNGALENYVFFENDASKYFITQNTKADGTLSSLEGLYRTDSLDLEFDGWYTEDGDKVTLETAFTEYTILYDRWKDTTLSSEDIISTLEIGTPLLEAGKTADTYGTSAIAVTDDRLSIESVSVYEGLNAYRTNKLENGDVLEEGKSYSLRVELHTKNGELIDDQLISHTTANYGLVANMLYSHDYSGIFTTQWTNREDKIQVIINYDYEDYYFTYDFVDKVVENGQSPQYTVYVSNNANVQGMELFVKNANDTWASLGAVTGQFNIPANSNIVKQYRVEVTYQNGFVISSNTFKVDWYDPNAPKFITQPTDYNVAYGTNVLVTWGLNCDVASIKLEKYDGATWSEFQNATPTGATISALESGTYTFRAHATKNGDDILSDSFTVTWREAFEFTTQPQSHTVATGEEYTVTWATNQTPSVLQVYTEQGDGTYARSFNLAETATNYTFSADMFGYVKNYKLYASYDGVGYFSDVFTRTVIAGEFTSKPDSEINAIVGKDYLVEWDFTLDVKYYNIKVHDGNDFVQFATTDKPEYNFTASEVGEKQFFIQAYNANDQIIGEDYLMFRINWTEQQIVYLVSFNANGGEGTMASVEQNAGAEYTLPDCGFTAPEYMEFKAWSVNEVEKQVGESITINANTVVKAVWQQLFIVAYAPGEGVGSAEFEYVTTGTTVTLLTPTDAYLGYEAPEGKKFAHWKVCKDNASDPNAVVKNPGDEITITFETYIIAVWEVIPVVPTGLTASYNGTILAGNKLAINQLTVKLQYSDSSEMPCGALCEYWYNGSIIDDPINYVFGEELIGNLTITVKYQGFETTFDVQVVGYEIIFNANGGTGVMAGDERVGEYTLPACTFIAPSGKQFKGWATSASGEVIGATYTLTANVEFFAIWEDIPHVHALTPVVATPATCTENGNTAYYTCNCGQWFSDSEGNTLIVDHSSVIIPATNHNYEGVAWSSDANEHYKVCKNNNCNEKGEVATHIPNIANPTEEEAKVCPVCQYVIAPALNHTHALTPVVAKGATCTENGNVAYYTCNCGQWFSDENATNLIDNHDSVIVLASGHTDVNTDGTCDTCGWVDPNFTPVVPGPGGGNEGGQGGSTPAPTPDNTPDNTPDTAPEVEGEEEGLSGGAIAGIAVGATAGAVGLGAGGFAIFWFVIKKKSLAELLAIFKKAPKATTSGTPDIPTETDDITE